MRAATSQSRPESPCSPLVLAVPWSRRNGQHRPITSNSRSGRETRATKSKGERLRGETSNGNGSNEPAFEARVMFPLFRDQRDGMHTYPGYYLDTWMKQA